MHPESDRSWVLRQNPPAACWSRTVFPDLTPKSPDPYRKKGRIFSALSVPRFLPKGADFPHIPERTFYTAGGFPPHRHHDRLHSAEESFFPPGSDCFRRRPYRLRFFWSAGSPAPLPPASSASVPWYRPFQVILPPGSENRSVQSHEAAGRDPLRKTFRSCHSETQFLLLLSYLLSPVGALLFH